MTGAKAKGAPRAFPAFAAGRLMIRTKEGAVAPFRLNAVQRALHRRLEALTLDHGGRLYVAKDALMAPESYAAMFPRLNAFRAVLARVDPVGRFQSDMSRRLRLRPDIAG